MLSWLKHKTIWRIKQWYTRQFVRITGELVQDRLRENERNAPKELKSYHSLGILMNGNATALHNLYRKAKDTKKFQEAFLYFFYEFEINLKHMIISEMMVINQIETMLSRKLDHYLVYTEDELFNVQKIGHISELIKRFVGIYGNEIEKDLTEINKARNFIIHNMLKERMNEKQIERSFENFFISVNSQINNSCRFFIKKLEERPGRLQGPAKETHGTS